MSNTPPSTLYYAHDPMCSWCWGFAPVWKQLKGALPRDIKVARLLGGLAADSEEPMRPEMRHNLQSTWRRIQERIPGTEFNFDFWGKCEPRRSTWRACRGVIAARSQETEAEEWMIAAIQRAYYLEARNPSDIDTLGDLAKQLGLNEPLFLDRIDHPDTQADLGREIAACQRLGLTSFPSLAFETRGTAWPITVDYHDPKGMIDQIEVLTAP